MILIKNKLMSDTFLKEKYGEFNGEEFIEEGTGSSYRIPANYASKSMLVQGDKLKLVLTENGMLFKQISPVQRIRFIGKVRVVNDVHYIINEANNKTYRVLYASISYHKLEDGSFVMGIIPKNMESEWCAIEESLPNGV